MRRRLLFVPGTRLIFLAVLFASLTLGTAAAEESTTHFEDDFSGGFSAQGPEAN